MEGNTRRTPLGLRFDRGDSMITTNTAYACVNKRDRRAPRAHSVHGQGRLHSGRPSFRPYRIHMRRDCLGINIDLAPEIVDFIVSIDGRFMILANGGIIALHTVSSVSPA